MLASRIPASKVAEVVHEGGWYSRRVEACEQNTLRGSSGDETSIVLLPLSSIRY